MRVSPYSRERGIAGLERDDESGRTIVERAYRR